MKFKRQKNAKKNLNFYKNNFGFREPYQVLVDGTFCQLALQNQIQIKEQMPKYLMGEVQLCTTSCVIKEMECLGKLVYGAKLIAQRFQVRRCAHSQSPVSATECLFSMVADDNSHHYFLATQDWVLANKVKKRGGIPVMFIIQNTIVLDKPSPKSLASAQAAQANQMFPEHQKRMLEHLKEEQGIPLVPESKGKKRKRVGGPNPLSCLKKKKKNEPKAPAPDPEQKSKRKRKKRKRKPSANPTA